MNLQYLKKSLIILVLLITGCQNIYGQTLPKVKPTEARNISTPLKSSKSSTPLAPTLEPTKESTIEPISTLKNNISFASIKPGQYILVNASDEHSNFYLYVVTTSGNIEKKILITNGNWSTSADGNLIFFAPFSTEMVERASIFNLSVEKWEDVDVQGQCQNIILSPDNQYISFDCFDNGTYDIYLLNKLSNSVKKMTNCKENHLMCFSSPAWSLDGKWFAYNRVEEQRSGVQNSPLDGFYIFSPNCFNDNSCMKKQFGPIHSDTPITWSKNNELIGSMNGEIEFYEIKNSVTVLSKEIKTGMKNIQNVYSSPDGQYFVYTYDTSNTEKTINILSLSNNLSQELLKVSYDDNIIGWIVIP